MAENGDCKIGMTSKAPETRMRQLQTGASDALRLMHAFKTRNMRMLERMLHAKFAGKRKTGEWFSLEESDVKGFADTCRRMEKNIEVLEADNHYVRKKYGL